MEISTKKKQRYIPDFSRIKCTVHMLLIYVAEETEKNKDFIFCSKDIANIFGISRDAAWHLIRRVEEFRNFEKVIESLFMKRKDETNLNTPIHLPAYYKITPIGMRYAKKLTDDMDKEILSPRAYRIKKEFEYLEYLQKSVMESI